MVELGHAIKIRIILLLIEIGWKCISFYYFWGVKLVLQLKKKKNYHHIFTWEMLILCFSIKLSFANSQFGGWKDSFQG